MQTIQSIPLNAHNSTIPEHPRHPISLCTSQREVQRLRRFVQHLVSMRGVIGEHRATSSNQIQLRPQELPRPGISKSIHFKCRENAASNIGKYSNIRANAQLFEDGGALPERNATDCGISICGESERCSKEAVPSVRHDPSEENVGRVPGHDEHEHGRSVPIKYEPLGSQCRQVRTCNGGDDCMINRIQTSHDMIDHRRAHPATRVLLNTTRLFFV